LKACDEHIRQTLTLVEEMLRLADEGDASREDVGCGILYGVLRDSAFKIQKLAAIERDAHIRKGWWQASAAIEAGRVFKRSEPVLWRCRNCGFIVEAGQAPEFCPACAHAQAHFELLGKNG